MPNVVGWSQSNAVDTLREAGFTVVVNSEENDSVEAGVVFYQSVTGTASKGAEIVLTVSSGSSKAEIPGVVGLTESEASAALGNAGFNVVTSYTSSDVISNGYVVSQSSSGMATRGSTVEIQVSTGPEKPVEPTPSSSSSASSSSASSSSSSVSPSPSHSDESANAETSNG